MQEDAVDQSGAKPDAIEIPVSSGVGGLDPPASKIPTNTMPQRWVPSSFRIIRTECAAWNAQLGCWGCRGRTARAPKAKPGHCRSLGFLHLSILGSRTSWPAIAVFSAVRRPGAHKVVPLRRQLVSYLAQWLSAYLSGIVVASLACRATIRSGASWDGR